jgi:hypothetical protein
VPSLLGFYATVYGVVEGHHGARRVGLLPNVRVVGVERWSVLAKGERASTRVVIISSNISSQSVTRSVSGNGSRPKIKNNF